MQVYENTASITIHVSVPRGGRLPVLLPVTTTADEYAIALRGDRVRLVGGKVAGLCILTPTADGGE
jgi:hypothetical protein